MNILLTSVGRRVELLKAFRQSMRRSNITAKIVTADLKKSAPASFLADTAELALEHDGLQKKDANGWPRRTVAGASGSANRAPPEPDHTPNRLSV